MRGVSEFARVPQAILQGAIRSLSTTSFTTIPVIDISALVREDASDSATQECARQLHQACTHVGFFYVKNHGIPEQTYRGALQGARRWFQLPDEVKQQAAIGPATHYRGYQKLGANVTRYEGTFQRDWHEAIDLYYELDPQNCQARGVQPSPIHGFNQWPHQDAEFNSVLRAYIASMTDLGRRIMTGIALGLGLKPTFFDEAHRGEPYWVVRVIHYPPLEPSADAAAAAEGITAADALAGADVPRSVGLSCGEHSDYGLLTIVNQEDEIDALQVKNADGKWITASPIPGTFVCNIGDMMRVWTNGLYTPTLHRVINLHPSKSRVSIPYFYEPGFETVVKPILGLHGSSHPPRFASIRYGTHLEKKVLSNFEL